MYRSKNTLNMHNTFNIRGNTSRSRVDVFKNDEFSKELRGLFFTLDSGRPFEGNSLVFEVEQNYEVQKCLVDWLSEIKLKLCLSQETYFLAVQVYFETIKTFKHRLNNLDHHLIMTTALFVAIKYEEVDQINLDTVTTFIAHNKFTKKQIVACEIVIMKHLKFRMPRPSFPEFIHRFMDTLFTYCLDSKDVARAKSQMIEFCFLLYKLTLMDNELTHNTKKKYLYLAIVYNSLYLYNTESDIDTFFLKILNLLDIKRHKIDRINKIIDRYFKLHIVNRKKCFILKEFDKLFESIN
jgi:hypothetical protein